MSTVTESTTLDALRRAILANPEDDIVRGVYADALDDRNEPGDMERAEFIRVQCELAKPYDEHAYTFWRGQLDAPKDVQHRDALRQRERELLEKWNRTWFYPTREQVLGYEVTRGFISEVRAPLSVLIGGACEQQHLRADDEPGVSGYDPPDCPACSGTGRTGGVLKKICRSQPVQRVVLTSPVPRQGENGWHCWTDADLPGELFVRLARPLPTYSDKDVNWYESRDSAINAASDVIISWAK